MLYFVIPLFLLTFASKDKPIMKKKSVLIDLYNLETPYCGFGQIAFNYVKYFAEIQRSGKENFDIAFLLPNSYRHRPLDEFEGIPCYFKESKLHHMIHIIPNSLPKVDLWHSVNQFCETYPNNPNTKHIFTIHDLNFLFEETPEKVDYYLSIMQERIDKANLITFISKYAEDITRKHLKLERKETRVIYNGVESLQDKSQTKPSFVVKEKPFFFAIGQILPKKRFDLLLYMMKFFPDMELYICGENKFATGQELLKRIEESQLPNVHAPGPITNEERTWLFANCEAYLFPSIGEGFGLPAIEAMQFGKPVFASNYQSLPEIVGNQGFVWHELEPISMAQTVKDGLKAFHADPNLAQIAKNYANTFSYEKHINAYLQLYREMLFT